MGKHANTRGNVNLDDVMGMGGFIEDQKHAKLLRQD